MKVYRLVCGSGHDFEAWFASAEAFDQQSETGTLACPACDNRSVVRLPSAPYVNTGAREASPPPPATQAAMSPEAAAALAALKAYVKANTVDVGREFPEVARRIHYGEEDPRAIRGRVTPAEAVELMEEGIEAVPLPEGIAPDEGLH